MLKLYIPTSRSQLRQFKLYANNFTSELDREFENIAINLKRECMQIPQSFEIKDKEPTKKLKESLKYLDKRVQYFDEYCTLINTHKKMHNVKITHSIDVAYDSKRVGLDLELFNEENIKILWSCGLLHDIGRFMQLRLTGTFKDAESFSENNFGKISNHGELGEKILIEDERIKMFFPLTRKYDEFIGKVVGNHYESKIKDYPIDINDNTFRIYTLEEIIKDRENGRESSYEAYNKLISWYVKIIQDVDRLDILKQIERGDFVPLLSNDSKYDVKESVYDLFYNGKYINMNELKKKGLWTCNAGQLLRWSFIYQLSLVGTIKNIKNLNLIEKIWERNPIDNLKPGYEFIMSLMDALIETSPDGVYVDKQKALTKVKGTK